MKKITLIVEDETQQIVVMGEVADGLFDIDHVVKQITDEQLVAGYPFLHPLRFHLRFRVVVEPGPNAVVFARAKQ